MNPCDGCWWILCPWCSETHSPRCNSLHTVWHKKVEILYIYCWSGLVLTNGPCALLFAEGRLQSTSYPRSHEIREQTSPKTWQVRYNWDFRAKRKAPLVFSDLSSVDICRLCLYVNRQNTEVKRKMLHHLNLWISSWCWRMDRDVVHCSVRPRPLVFPCACRKKQAVCSHYVTNMLCLYTMLHFHYWSGQPLVVEFLWICVHLYVSSRVSLDVFWWSAMPWGQTPPWPIDWCRQLLLSMPRKVACCTREQLPCKNHQSSIMMWCATVWISLDFLTNLKDFDDDARNILHSSQPGALLISEPFNSVNFLCQLICTYGKVMILY